MVVNSFSPKYQISNPQKQNNSEKGGKWQNNNEKGDSDKVLLPTAKPRNSTEWTDTDTFCLTVKSVGV